MRELTVRETEEVGGAVGIPGSAVGAACGAIGYLSGAATSGQFSWGGLATYTAGGAVSGFITGPIGATRAYFLSKASFGMGAVYGMGI